MKIFLYSVTLIFVFFTISCNVSETTKLIKSCNKGYGDACFDVAQNYENGIGGVKQDLPKAIEFYTKGCENSNGKACNTSPLL